MVTVTTSMSSEIAAATRNARSKPAASACSRIAACTRAVAAGEAAARDAVRAAATVWARALSATTVQARVPITARPRAPPT
jgi:hypothetical protein